MNNKAGLFFAFLVGAVSGYAFGKLSAKKRYEARMDEEIESVKEAFARKEEKKKEDAVPKKNTEKAIEQKENRTVAVRYSKKEPAADPAIRVIPPQEFKENEEYESAVFVYYLDGILADEEDGVMSDEDISKSVGLESLNHFGEWEDDSVFVVNDRLKTYYQILKEERTYEDMARESGKLYLIKG